MYSPLTTKKVACVGASLLLMAGMAFADASSATREPANPNDKQTAAQAQPPPAEKLARFNGNRASKCIGNTVVNKEGKELGTVQDIVLDGGLNRISYSVLSYGGFMGMGDKLFAIPYGAFQKDPNSKGQEILDIPEQVLKDAPGFDKSNWPDMADPAIRGRINQYYKTYTSNEVDANGNPIIDVTNSNATALPKTGPTTHGLLWCRRVSKVLNANIRNQNNESIGQIKDLVVDHATGEVPFAVVGFETDSKNYYTVPMNAFDSKPDAKELVLIPPTDRVFKGPKFETNAWPDWNSIEYRNQLQLYYGEYYPAHKNTPPPSSNTNANQNLDGNSQPRK